MPRGLARRVPSPHVSHVIALVPVGGWGGGILPLLVWAWLVGRVLSDSYMGNPS
jgi:hypothetical protein